MIERTGFFPVLIALQTLLRREILRFVRIWTQTLLPPAITMALYFLVFGKLIGSQIDDIHGYRYIQYIVPGLALMSVMTNAYSNTASSFFLTKFNKSIEEMIVSPMPSLVILLGFSIGGAIRGLTVGIIVIFIAMLFTHVPMQHLSLMFVIIFLTAMVFSLSGLINGIYARNFDDISFIPTFVLTPLTYLGGVFYSTQQLQEPWRTLSQLNPIFNMVDAFRYGTLGISDLNVYIGLTLITLLFFILFFLAWHLLIKGVGVKV